MQAPGGSMKHLLLEHDSSIACICCSTRSSSAAANGSFQPAYTTFELKKATPYPSGVVSLDYIGRCPTS